MKKILVAAVLCLCACDKRYLGPERTETATVLDTVFVPATHGSGTGIDMKGRMTFTSIETSPVWGVVFACEHGKFVKQGSDEQDRYLWQSMKKDSKVTIRYAEKIREDGDGNKTLEGYKFIGAK